MFKIPEISYINMRPSKFYGAVYLTFAIFVALAYASGIADYAVENLIIGGIMTTALFGPMIFVRIKSLLGLAHACVVSTLLSLGYFTTFASLMYLQTV